jgi:hypothetical protein
MTVISSVVVSVDERQSSKLVASNTTQYIIESLTCTERVQQAAQLL